MRPKSPEVSIEILMISLFYNEYMNQEEYINKRSLNIGIFTFIKVHVFSTIPVFYMFFTSSLDSMRNTKM